MQLIGLEIVSSMGRLVNEKESQLKIIHCYRKMNSIFSLSELVPVKKLLFHFEYLCIYGNPSGTYSCPSSHTEFI